MAGEDEVKLLGTWTSPYTRRVEISLKLKGIPYEYVEIDLRNKSPLLLESNPVHKKVPVLIHNGIPIAESMVILEYIDETWKSNPIFPQDPHDRALVRFWCKFIDEKVLAPGRKAMLGDEKEREAAHKESYESVKILENELKGKKFFGGEEFGVVDMAAVAVALWIPAAEQAMGTANFTRDAFPLLWGWADEILSCPVFKDNLPSLEKLSAAYKFRVQEVMAMARTT